LIYLQAPVEVLLNRIQQRGRNIESGITADYLRLLESFYDDWLQTFDVCPVLTIRTDDLDYVHRPKHLNIVVQRIQERLAGREEVIFPTNSA
jgi:deoxyadenosine/deoxycytidine kinase